MSRAKYKLILHSNQNEVSRVEKLIEKCAKEHNLSDDLHGTLAIVITELVNNAIIHGNKLDESKKVQLTIELNDKNLLARISDEGSGFKHRDLPDPREKENIGKSGGRGVFIASQMMDSIEYYNTNSGLTVEAQIKLDFA